MRGCLLLSEDEEEIEVSALLSSTDADRNEELIPLTGVPTGAETNAATVGTAARARANGEIFMTGCCSLLFLGLNALVLVALFCFMVTPATSQHRQGPDSCDPLDKEQMGSWMFNWKISFYDHILF